MFLKKINGLNIFGAVCLYLFILPISATARISFMNISAVKLRSTLQIYRIEDSSVFFNHDTQVLVETENGIDIGRIVKMRCPACPKSVNENNEKEQTQNRAKFIRIADESDLSQIPEIEKLEDEAFRECKERAVLLELNLKLVAVKSIFSRTKIIFYFVAESRVDFRELVRELAAVFKTRIEMRQIGVREEAKLIGDYGACGRLQCCSILGEEFEPVSMKMAKEQNLNFSSMKISGMCGRLLCCLAYEYETYIDLNTDMPEVGSMVICEEDSYTVTSVDLLKQTLTINSENRMLTLSKNDIEKRNNFYSIKKGSLSAGIVQEDDGSDEDSYY